jgi:hypothetical protein
MLFYNRCIRENVILNSYFHSFDGLKKILLNLDFFFQSIAIVNLKIGFKVIGL